jgi:hypothetical protein
MMTVIAIFTVLIFLLLVTGAVAGVLAWQKISLFLTYNTRYQASEYEQAVMATGKTARPKLPSLPAKKTLDERGRMPKNVDEMVDLQDLGVERGYDEIAKLGEIS